MNMYAKLGDVEEAWWLFYVISERDVVSWTTLSDGYVGTGMLSLLASFLMIHPIRMEWLGMPWLLDMLPVVVSKRRFLLYEKMQVHDLI